MMELTPNQRRFSFLIRPVTFDIEQRRSTNAHCPRNCCMLVFIEKLPQSTQDADERRHSVSGVVEFVVRRIEPFRGSRVH